ncbi:hypothetical protein [Salinimicrobium soli]|uniref:hypothetical protein n=1 Tax=Salinimicrobium soli TaxID=1254399 RepID=UPI003AAD8649
MSTLKTTSDVSGQVKKLTILKVYSLIYIFGCLGFALLNWKVLTYEEGWGMVGMIGLISLGLLGLIVDFILIKLIPTKWLFHLIELLIVFFFSIELWISFKK